MQSRYYGIGERIDRSMEENGAKKLTHIINWSLTKKGSQYNGVNVVFSSNGTGTTGHPHAKKWLQQTLHFLQKLTQNGNWPRCKTEICKTHLR